MPTPGFAVTVDGARIYVDLDDQRGARLIESHGNFNPHSLELWNLALGLHEWELVLDVGANYGEMLVGGRFPVDARVRAFEPNGVVRESLSRTLAEIDLEVELSPLAVGREPGMLDFAIDTEWSGTSTLHDAEAHMGPRWRHEQVEVTTIDVLVADAASVCVKIDVEGLELEVLAGAAELLASTRPHAIMFEILHMSAHDVSTLATRHPLYVLDTRLGRLVRLVGGNPDVLRALLTSGWLYPQDALLLAHPNEEESPDR